MDQMKFLFAVAASFALLSGCATGTSADSAHSPIPKEDVKSGPKPESAALERRANIGPDFPDTRAFYPSTARTWNEEGTVAVHFCVDDTGHLTESPRVQASSGLDELDAAALKLANAADGHFLPAYSNGR